VDPGQLSYDESCLFCRIAAGEEPAAKVLDEPDHVGFLDVRPLFHGHVLLVPREHVPTFPDLAPERVGPLFARAQDVCRAVMAAHDAPGTFVAMNNVVSQSVPHLHVHVVPRRRKDGLRGFFWPRTTYADLAEMEEVAAGIAAHLPR
jgi:histidine triad (HIT) family protein